MKQKRIFFTAACILAAVGAMAQGNGQAGITEATQMVTSYFEPGTKLIYAIGAVVGLIGGVKVGSSAPATPTRRRRRRAGSEPASS